MRRNCNLHLTFLLHLLCFRITKSLSLIFLVAFIVSYCYNESDSDLATLMCPVIITISPSPIFHVLHLLCLVLTTSLSMNLAQYHPSGGRWGLGCAHATRSGTDPQGLAGALVRARRGGRPAAIYIPSSSLWCAINTNGVRRHGHCSSRVTVINSRICCWSEYDTNHIPQVRKQF